MRTWLRRVLVALIFAFMAIAAVNTLVARRVDYPDASRRSPPGRLAPGVRQAA